MRSSALSARSSVALMWVLVLRNAFGLDIEDVSFYAPFDGQLEAVIAAGASKPLGERPPQVEFVPGAVGQAAVTGRSMEQSLSYSVANHLNEKAGSLSIWFKPINWQSGDSQQHVVLRIGGRLLLYHYWEGNTMSFYWMSGSTVLWGPGYLYLNIDRDHWHHMAFTWGDRKCTAYYNGQCQGQTIDMPEDVPAWTDGGSLTLSPPDWTKDGRNLTAIDELMMFNRPLSEQEVKSLYRRVVVTLPDPQLRIGQVSTAPKTDGALSRGDWEGAAAAADFVDGLFGNLSRRLVTSSMCYDDKALYLAVRSPWDATPKSPEELEIWLAGLNLASTTHRFVFKADGAVQHEVNGQLDADKAEERARFQVAKDPKGSATCFEAMIPWLLLTTEPPKPGGAFRLNLLRRWSQRYGDLASWADLSKAGSGWKGHTAPANNPNGWGRITLGGNQPVLLMEDVGPLNYAQLDLKARLLQSGGVGQQVSAEVRLQPSDLKEIENPQTFVRTWTGTQMKLDQALNLTRAATNLRAKTSFSDLDINSLWLRITDAAGALVYQAQRPFVAQPPVVTSVQLYPSSSRVEIQADVSNYREAPLGELSTAVELVDPAGRVLEQARIAKFDSPRQTVRLPLGPLPLGKIVARTTLKHGAQAISSFETSFEKIARGPWFGNKLGRDEIVIAPFTPVKVEGQTVAMWGRTYLWKDSLFPVQITSAGQELLAGPMELMVVAAPTEQMKLTGQPNGAQVTVREHTDTRAVVECVGTLGEARIRAQHTLEVDGMCLTRLEITPPAQLPGLSLCIPLKPEQSTLYHHFCNGGTVRGAENRGRGVGLKGKADFGLMHTFWLGNEERGLTWFAESAAGWELGKGPTAMSVFADKQATYLILRFANHPIELKEPMTLTFGVIATPIKKLRDNWRFMRVRRDWCYDWFMSFTPSNNYITHVHPTWKAYLAKQLGKYPFFVPYQRPDWINTKEPEATYFRNEWQSVPPSVSGSDDGSPNTHLSVCLGSEWADFMLYYALKAYDENNMVGYYFDGGLPRDCKNAAHGHGWKDAKGDLKTSYPLLAYREFYKRLAIEFYKRGRPYLIWVHASNCLEMPTLSFADMVWDGEQFSVAATESRNYASLFTLSYFRGEFLGQQFGLPVQWLVEFFDKPGKEPIGTRELDTMLLFALVHGVGDNTLASQIPRAELSDYVRRVLEAQDAFGVRQPGCRFLPYWKNEGYVSIEPQDDDLACSIWQRSGKALVILANAAPDKRQIRARLNLESLGLKGQLRASELMIQAPVPVEGGIISMEMMPASWRGIVVEGSG